MDKAQPYHEEIRIPVDGDMVAGDLHVPSDARGIVVFAHGSGSSRHSRRNQQVSKVLVDQGFATLLMDLLTEREEQIDLRTRELRFDIRLLASRVVAALDWVGSDHRTAHLPVGLFGTSTGAAAALVAAAERSDVVVAVVSRGGRPDLACESLSRVPVPTLLIVGGADRPVIDMNETARGQMPGEVDLQIVEGATHLFEEPGALEKVADLAAGHFRRTLGGAGTR